MPGIKKIRISDLKWNYRIKKRYRDFDFSGHFIDENISIFVDQSTTRNFHVNLIVRYDGCNGWTNFQYNGKPQ